MEVIDVILFLVTGTFVSCTEYVPVLIWSSQTAEDSFPVVPAFSRLTSNEFTDYLLKRIKVENPLILLFMEENLSVEDFSWKDLNGYDAYPMLTNITTMADDVAFLPSVHEPYRSVKKLKNHGYTWRYYEKENFESLKDGKNAIYEVKLNEPYYLENRPDMLKRHDEEMAKVYNEALSYKQNVMVIYSGSHTSWIDADLGRFKREEKETNGNSSNTLIITDEKNIIRMATTPPIIYKKNGTVVHITKVIGIPTIQENKPHLIFRVRFPLGNNEDVSVNFNFTSVEKDWWSLNSAEVLEMKELNLKPSDSIGAPSGQSYFCNPTITFTNNNISFTFENFQVQPRVGEGHSFGPVVHCIPFFSIAIWSGLVVVFILSVVLAWGITMIMDINTNDRFDNPKGRTITISATD